jgi:hypothetical protein
VVEEAAAVTRFSDRALAVPEALEEEAQLDYQVIAEAQVPQDKVITAEGVISAVYSALGRMRLAAAAEPVRQAPMAHIKTAATAEMECITATYSAPM